MKISFLLRLVAKWKIDRRKKKIKKKFSILFSWQSCQEKEWRTYKNSSILKLPIEALGILIILILKIKLLFYFSYFLFSFHWKNKKNFFYFHLSHFFSLHFFNPNFKQRFFFFFFPFSKGANPFQVHTCQPNVNEVDTKPWVSFLFKPKYIQTDVKWKGRGLVMLFRAVLLKIACQRIMRSVSLNDCQSHFSLKLQQGLRGWEIFFKI